ncbi:MAG TPA: hypothetical protein VHC22_17785 [Pirellulales bacterium]|nr:hypothetical protein [Pirellulales bacterium]
MTKVNGQVQKNGGNVVSYFLTPDGLVVNAVVGPVNADKLLAEAEWAVETYKNAAGMGRKHALAQAPYIAQAHFMLANDRTHKLLAQHPLAPLTMIQQEVFEELAGQKASVDRSVVTLAATGFQQAKDKGLPVLLVLSKAQPKPGEWDKPTAALLVGLNSPPTAQPVHACVLVVLPIDELPALTSLVKLPDMDMADRATPTMLLFKSDGTQIAAMSPQADPSKVAKQLWSAVNEARLAKADKLIEQGRTREATALLRLVKSTPQGGQFKQDAIERLAQLQPLPAQRGAKTAASDKSTSVTDSKPVSDGELVADGEPVVDNKPVGSEPISDSMRIRNRNGVWSRE